MENYVIDFSGYCLIEADSEEEAEEKFWELRAGLRGPFLDWTFECDNIELQ